jgi:hypothetical protein
MSYLVIFVMIHYTIIWYSKYDISFMLYFLPSVDSFKNKGNLLKGNGKVFSFVLLKGKWA